MISMVLWTLKPLAQLSAMRWTSIKVKFILVDSLMTMSFASDDWQLPERLSLICLANAARGLSMST